MAESILLSVDSENVGYNFFIAILDSGLNFTQKDNK